MSDFPPPDARLYVEPACFVDRPHGLDGRFRQLAGGALYFTAWKVRWRPESGGAQSGEALVPVEAMAEWSGRLPPAQSAREDVMRQDAVKPRPPMELGNRTLRFAEPQVMGILNLTPDSFSDGGRFDGDTASATSAGVEIAMQGAAIVDVGGESTRPGAPLVWEGDESKRVVPVIEQLAASGTLVSVDTRKAQVMEDALAAGAAIVNDISALLYDERALEVVRRAKCPVVLMHAPSQSSDPHADARYHDVLLDVYDWLEQRRHDVIVAGVAYDRIIVDPGIGFGKSVAENLKLINGLALFQSLGCPVLVGASRKRLIGALDGEAPADRRLGGSIALHLLAAQRGAQILRVHDVQETVQAIKVWRGMRDAALVG